MYTIGVISDVTDPSGPYSLGAGLRAGVGVAAEDGYTIKYIFGTSPEFSANGALMAAQRLVDEDHVFAVVLISSLGYLAARWLTAQGVPVIGAPFDSTEWQTSPNMFSVAPIYDPKKPPRDIMKMFKRLGATNVATVGYGLAPSSSESAKAYARAAKVAGLKVGYLNANLPLGTTNVGPIALAMKNAGVDGFIADIDAATSFAAVEQARQDGVDFKVVLMGFGYGGDLALGGKGAETIAQNMYFDFPFEPVELQTSATERFQNALRTYAGVNGEPTEFDYWGFLSIDGLVTGLKAAGPNPSRQNLINAMSRIIDYRAAGLLGNERLSWSSGWRTELPTFCIWVTQYVGSTFHPVSGASPLC
jgi:branched-chain amino acid transport system substrate-binding protein